MAIEHLSQLDLNGTYSYADYLTWKFEQAVELIKGKILPMAAPNTRHQQISWRIGAKLAYFLEKKPCHPFAAPFDVRLYDKRKSEKANKDIYTVVQPDLCVICDETKLDDRGCIGAPDLVIEILSVGNSAKEMKTKKELYEENAVREYLVFDPEREHVFQYKLNDDGVYLAPDIIVIGDLLTSIVFPDLTINLEDIFKTTTKATEE
jgi:Uma2 family endonuclease